MEISENTPLQYTFLPVRAANILRRHHIETVGDLLQHSQKELMHLHGFGKGCLAAVEELKRQVEEPRMATADEIAEKATKRV